MPFLARLLVFVLFLPLLLGLLMPLVGFLRDRPAAITVAESYELLPAPWLTPRTPDGAALHLAMVHDVLHERYLRHGSAWYEARQQRASALLAASDEHGPDQARALELLDDLAVGCERLGRPEEGIVFARRKLAVQQPGRGVGDAAPDSASYTTYANLGTLLVHANLAHAIAGDAGAMAAAREGLGWIRLAMRANPSAHFGREAWQAQAVAFLLDAVATPERLRHCDIAGMSPENLPWFPHTTYAARADALALAQRDYAYQRAAGAADSALQAYAQRIRHAIPAYASGLALEQPDAANQYREIPFDQPTLGIIGMWTLGGGANPHFAFALGHLMELVQQRHIAWNAYERAIELSERWWPDAVIRDDLVAQCRSRQERIEHHLHEDPLRLRQAHRQELADGQSRQKEFQDFERVRLAAGADPYSTDFYQEFDRTHARIATPSGDEDTVRHDIRPWWSFAPFFLGLAALAALFWLSLRACHLQVKREWRAPLE